jgi:hypothetical protein
MCFAENVYVTIERLYDLIPVGNRQRAARAEIILRIDNHQRVFSVHRFQL